MSDVNTLIDKLCVAEFISQFQVMVEIFRHHSNWFFLSPTHKLTSISSVYFTELCAFSCKSVPFFF